MGSPLLLGPVAFDAFEVPERLSFGGAQRLAVHRLPGGGRVVDALGRDDAELSWAGVFSGPAAADRARQLDWLRVQGAPLTLTWDAFLYTVAIARFEAEYAAPWWIPYRIACTVLRDEAQALVQAAVQAVAGLLDSVAADVASAAGGLDVSGVQAALAVSGACVAGSAAQAAALAALGGARGQVESGLAAAGAALGAAADLPSAVDAAGRLAALADARGYVARAQANLADAST